MRFTKKAARIALVGLFASSGAFAAGPSGTAELALGYAQQEVDDGFDTLKGNDLSVAARISANLTKNFAIEGGYWFVGEAEDTLNGIDFTSDVDALMVGGKAMLPINETTVVYGRAGFAAWDQELSAQGFDAGDDDGTDPYFGFGVQVAVTPDLVVGADYTYLELDASLDGFSIDTEIQQFAVHAGLRF